MESGIEGDQSGPIESQLIASPRFYIAPIKIIRTKLSGVTDACVNFLKGMLTLLPLLLLLCVWINTELRQNAIADAAANCKDTYRPDSVLDQRPQQTRPKISTCKLSHEQFVRYEATQTPVGEYIRNPIVQNIFVLIVLLAIIFFADALEVSYSLLRYKLLDQFSGTTRKMLTEMHRDEDVIYEAREWLVTILIVAITLMGEFGQDEIYFPLLTEPLPALHIPGILTIKAKTLFSLLFATLPVLWIAQGPSKRLARRCPQKMLFHGWLVWTLIKGVGRITKILSAPTELLAGKLEESESFRTDLILKPSDDAYFVASVQRYGYAIHDLKMNISIKSDGSCTIGQRVLYYIFSRPGNVFERKLNLDSPSIGFTPGDLLAYSVPEIQEADPTGKAKSLWHVLDSIADRNNVSQEAEHLPAHLTITEVQDDSVPNTTHYRIHTNGLNPAPDKALAILASFTSTWSPNAMNLGLGVSDFFFMAFDCPCYRYRLTVDTVPDCEIELIAPIPEAFCGSDPHWGERDRLEKALTFDPNSPEAIHADFYYPFPGIRYRISWRNRLRPLNPAHSERSRQTIKE